MRKSICIDLHLLDVCRLLLSSSRWSYTRDIPLIENTALSSPSLEAFKLAADSVLILKHVTVKSIPVLTLLKAILFVISLLKIEQLLRTIEDGIS